MGENQPKQISCHCPCKSQQWRLGCQVRISESQRRAVLASRLWRPLPDLQLAVLQVSGAWGGIDVCVQLHGSIKVLVRHGHGELCLSSTSLNNWNVSNDVRKMRRMFNGEQRRLEPEEGVAHDVAKKNNSSGFATRKRRGTS